MLTVLDYYACLLDFIGMHSSWLQVLTFKYPMFPFLTYNQERNAWAGDGAQC